MKQKSTLELQNFMPYRLSVLTNRISTLISTAYSESFGIRIPEWRTIAVLGDTSRLTNSQIAERTAMDKVTVSRAVRDLVQKRLVARRTSRKDRRVVYLNLTREGKSVYLQIVPMALRYEAQILGILEENEREYLDHLLTKLQLGVDELSAGP
ncbi:MAG: MarR family transcriptional regulator [Gammaproteobacteria bacterium]|nr:MarR family transcriptional regulator [Gammaproteobacteria bacterium]MYD79113.1 MarR family transcriptional regulator [Gammaproteobacteria bacterium]